jgi:hypothetical protein
MRGKRPPMRETQRLSDKEAPLKEMADIISQRIQRWSENKDREL